MEVNSIGEVVTQLDQIIDWSKHHKSRLGYFPALYRKMTLRVKAGIEDGFFDDGPRMETITVAFANRYFRAYDDYLAGRHTTKSWQLAFGAARRWWPIVSQHLLLGVNAHINLDLGIAVAECIPREHLGEVRADFIRINEVLAELLDEVQDQLAMVWRCYRFFDWATGRTDEKIIAFSLAKARELSWQNVERFAALGEQERQDAIASLDQHVASVGRVVLRPGLYLGLLLKVVRLGEGSSIDEVVDILS